MSGSTEAAGLRASGDEYELQALYAAAEEGTGGTGGAGGAKAPTSATEFKWTQEIPAEAYGRSFRRLEKDETFLEGLRKLDPDLITTQRGNHGVTTRITVLEGQIGKATLYGRTKFFPPGTYYWAGIGGRYLGAEELQKEGQDTRVVHQDVTLASLAENEVMVVQIGKVQYLIGSGRYILRQPARLEGEPIDIQRLVDAHKTTVIVESTEDVRSRDGGVDTKDIQTRKEVTAGHTAKAGAFTLVRPQPGFHYVIQGLDGYRVGSEFTVARGNEKFLDFMNMLQQSRTTSKFEFLSADFHKVLVSVQFTWQLKDPVKWLENGRAYEDPFDLLEEKSQAYFRDEIQALKHEEALAQKADGFDDMEARILPKLKQEARRVGAELLTMEVRELSFPLIEAREMALAEKEAVAKEKIMQGRRDLEIQKLADQKSMETEQAEQARAIQKARADAAKLEINDQRALAEVQAKAAQAQAQVVAEAEREQARLEGLKAQESVKAETMRILAEAEAEAAKARAQGEAQSILTVQRAKNAAMLEKAEAEAQAAAKMADALERNPGLLQLKTAEIWGRVEAERAHALAEFAKNPQALLPDSMTKDLVRMRNGASPQEYMPWFGMPQPTPPANN